MFHSWTLKPDGTISERPRMFDPGTGKTSCPQACDHCRLKKVKCTGEKSGCQRCQALSRTCSYSQPSRAQVQAASQSLRTRRQYRRRSPDWTISQEEPSPAEDTALASDSSTTPILSPTSVNTDSSQITSPVQSHETPTELALPEVPLLPLTWISEDIGMCLDEVSTSLPFDAGLDEFLYFGSEVDNEVYSNPVMMVLEGVQDGAINIHEHQDLSSFWLPPCSDDIETQPHIQDQQRIENHQSLSTQSLPIPPRMTHDYSNFADPTPLLPSPASSDSSTPDPATSCQCPRRIILLMDEVEDMLREEVAPSAKMPDLMLATLKEALNHIRSMLTCAKCTISVENMTLLTFLVANLSCLCQCLSKLLACSPTLPARSQEDNIRFRNYAIDTVVEYHAVVGGLLQLQVGELHALIEQLLDIAKEPETNGMVRRLTIAKSMLQRVDQRPMRAISVG